LYPSPPGCVKKLRLAVQGNHINSPDIQVGGNTFVVKAIPTLLDSGGIRAMIARLVEKAAEIGISVDMESILDACESPSHCPHGRTIWIQWTVKELDKQFQRIVN
jgi:DNA mismatch repair protein MutL